LRALLVTVVDPTLVVTQAAHRVLLPSGVPTAFADSFHELPFVLDANGLPDLLIVNVAGEITPYEAAVRLQRRRYRGRILVLVDDLSDPNVRHLTDLRHAECIRRPSSPGQLDQILHKAVLYPETQWPDEVQARARVGAKSDHVAGIGWDFRLEQDDIQWHKNSVRIAGRQSG